MTQEAFAEALGLSVSTYQGYEQGKNVPRGDRLDAIRERLATSQVSGGGDGQGGSQEPAPNHKDYLRRHGVTPPSERLQGERHGDVCLIRVYGPDDTPIFSYWLSGRTVQEGPEIALKLDANAAMRAAAAGAGLS